MCITRTGSGLRCTGRQSRVYTTGKGVEDLRQVVRGMDRPSGLSNGTEMCKEAFREDDWRSGMGILRLWRVGRKGLFGDGNNSGGGHFLC